MLDTRFPRPPGDVGNRLTFERAGIPVRFHVVAGASPQRAIRQADPRLLPPFIAAARTLAADGATLLTTSCGLLAAWQEALSLAVTIPVLTSTLLMCRSLQRPGIVTIDASSLTAAILAGAGVAAGVPIEGVEPEGEMQRSILGNDGEMDFDAVEQEVASATRRLLTRCPDISDLVLECTNMPPYRNAVIRAAAGRPVHDIETMLLAAWKER